MSKSVYEEYYKLWPESSREKLRGLLEKVPFIIYPRDRRLLNSVVGKPYIVIVEKATLATLVEVASYGFEHIVQRNREDFPQELLAASLMSVKPESFMRNPIPFFMSGFTTSKLLKDPDRHLILRFTKQLDKPTLLEWVGSFLDRKSDSAAIRDLCLQAADEMISNALFNAPVVLNKKRPFKDLDRTSDITLPSSLSAKLFMCFGEDRIVLGCQDFYGSLKKEDMLSRLREVLNERDNNFKIGSGGAGFGLRNLIQNSANFYTLVRPGKWTLVACGYRLQGLKSNMTAAKHLHFSFD
jgi:hypothetical protein